MAPDKENGPSRGLALYSVLLELYPRTYLQRHREELLQNFQDLERELPSKTALWCLIARDLIVSLRSELVRTLWGQTTIRFAILSLMLVIVSRYPDRQSAAWAFGCGYAPGWFAGWFGRQWRLSAGSESPGFGRSFSGQAAMLVAALTLVLAITLRFPYGQERLVLAFCYAAALAWFSGWWSNVRRTRLWH